MEFSFELSECRAYLRGSLTENADLAALATQLQGQVVVDLSGIKRINSCGVREWIKFVNQYVGPGVSLVLEKCSVTFVHQMNFISNFIGPCRVESVAVPLICSKCFAAREEVVGTSPLQLETFRPGPCSKCGGEMERDFTPDEYFSFLPA